MTFVYGFLDDLFNYSLHVHVACSIHSVDDCAMCHVSHWELWGNNNGPVNQNLANPRRVLLKSSTKDLDGDDSTSQLYFHHQPSGLVSIY